MYIVTQIDRQIDRQIDKYIDRQIDECDKLLYNKILITSPE